MDKVILAIDEGTTGVTTSLYNLHFKKLDEETLDFAQFFLPDGGVEHDLNLIENAIKTCLGQLLHRHPSVKIDAIGITNQRETTCFWNRKTGKPLRKALVWQDRRTTDLCKKFSRRLSSRVLQAKTGLLWDPYFSGTKMVWGLTRDAQVKAAARDGTLAMGTVDAYLIHKMTGLDSLVTEASNASRTLLMNLKTAEWDPVMLRLFKINRAMLPTIQPSFSIFGKTKNFAPLPDGIPITGVLGDQQAALLGQGAVAVNDAKCTYGTGAFLLVNTGKKPVKSRNRLLTTVAWQTPNQKLTYALEGSVFVAGAAVQWLRDGLKFFSASSEVEKLAGGAEDTAAPVMFVPALTGLGAPLWNSQARGAFFGLSRGTKIEDMALATLRGIAFQVNDLLVALRRDQKSKIKSLRVDGGAALNTLMMQFQSDISEVKILRPYDIESTSRGAAMAAAIGAGFYPSVEGAAEKIDVEKTYFPQLPATKRKSALARWKKALELTNRF